MDTEKCSKSENGICERTFVEWYKPWKKHGICFLFPVANTLRKSKGLDSQNINSVCLHHHASTLLKGDFCIERVLMTNDNQNSLAK